MSSETKTALKEARELLKQNEYAETIKRCKNVLKKDKNNYSALVLLGAAMRELDEYKLQAPLALQKATEIQPDNPLAWQGLVAYYEKEAQDENAWIKLASAYCKLLELDSISSKFSILLDKVSHLSLRVKTDGILALTIEALAKLRKVCDEDKCNIINKTLAWILINCPNILEFKELAMEVLAIVVNDTDVINRQEYYKQYLMLLYESRKFDALLTLAIQMHKEYSQDICPLAWICRIYYEEKLYRDNSINVDLSEFYEALLKLDPESEAGLLAKAMHLLTTDNLVHSRVCLNQLVSLKPQSFCAWLLMSKVNSRLHCWETVEVATTQALQLAKSNLEDRIREEIEFMYIESLCKSNDKQKWKDAARMCENLLAKTNLAQAKMLFARSQVQLNELPLQSQLDLLEMQDKTKDEAIFLQALALKNNKRLEEAADVLGSALKSSEAWLLLGKIYWELNDYNHSLMAFLTSAKKDCFDWECFVHLGRYYNEYGNNLDRARKCYQTALQINPNSEEAGIGLSTTYRLLKNSDANIQLLQKLTMQGRGPKWAWLQLGLQYLDHNDPMQAIKALQHVIRADPNNSHGWEALADAYLARGAHTSALKSYQRALELCSGSLYAMIQLANIKLVLGEHEEAKKDFESILQSDRRCIQALKGLAETCLGMARQNIVKQFLGRARRNLQEAADNLINAIIENNGLSCIWKLLGDTCYRTAAMSEKYCFLRIKSCLINPDGNEDFITFQRKELLSLATRCYCRALSLSKDSAFLWHDLACCYFKQLQYDSSADTNAVVEKCLAAAKQAVKLSPTSWMHWNLLGVICTSAYVKNYALAQHCYIMAIDRELNNAVAWSNLGTLYLHLNDPYRANEAYSRAQRADPAYMNSWIGQGLIAEQINRKEAMDLFRHATQLGYHDQACIGYAHWVLSMLLNPEAAKDSLYTYNMKNMHAVPVATDVLNWFIEHHPDDSYALNAHGLLLERQSLFKSSTEQYLLSLGTCSDERKDLIRVNLSRVLTQLERYGEAVHLCKSVQKATFTSQCHLALSLFKAKKYEESYATYESALQWLADSEFEKANTLCAMAAMAYIFQGAEDAKTLLFQCIQIRPFIVDGFLAAASLGILHRDLNLATLVLKELKPYEDSPEYGHHIASLSAYSYLMQEDIPSAIKVFSKAIHRRPDNVACWINLARILLEIDLTTFGKCAQKALLLGRNSSTRNIVHVACASSLSNLANSNTKDGFRSVQKTLFAFPGHIESWANFILAVSSRCSIKEYGLNTEWLSKLITILCENFQATKQMKSWLYLNKRKADELIGQTTVTY